ncbi:hypothetical protein [Pseudoalteromonas sp. MMG022]|uniref:hypothetical protein n=1 Tax=Pseudoalteromonas sp. MMG022 TaxID=2909978 RepID=UPI001F2CB5EC|nr:hypothetical protein [Pseudoalteromonas sp. MMG022]MCF6437001.1 hypothetical protein [Pseudoalteromonas sp. MMG022]
MSSQLQYSSDLQQLIDDFQEVLDNEQHERITDLLAQYPQSFELHFLDGSYQAEKGSYIQAKEAFERCLEANPDYGIARFQLCFLAVLNSDAETFNSYISPLLTQPEQGYLALFAQALVYILNDQVEQATQALSEGIMLNNENLALNENMRKVLMMIGDDKDAQPEQVNEADDDELTNSTNSVLLDIYKNKFN